MAKVRTQVQFERHQYEQLKRLSAQRGQSLSGLLRTLVDQALGTAPDTKSVRETRMGFVGAGRDAEGEEGVARAHDRHLYGERD